MKFVFFSSSFLPMLVEVVYVYVKYICGEGNAFNYTNCTTVSLVQWKPIVAIVAVDLSTIFVMFFSFSILFLLFCVRYGSTYVYAYIMRLPACHAYEVFLFNFFFLCVVVCWKLNEVVVSTRCDAGTWGSRSVWSRRKENIADVKNGTIVDIATRRCLWENRARWKRKCITSINLQWNLCSKKKRIRNTRWIAISISSVCRHRFDLFIGFFSFFVLLVLSTKGVFRRSVNESCDEKRDGEVQRPRTSLFLNAEKIRFLHICNLCIKIVIFSGVLFRRTWVWKETDDFH